MRRVVVVIALLFFCSSGAYAQQQTSGLIDGLVDGLGVLGEEGPALGSPAQTQGYSGSCTDLGVLVLGNPTQQAAGGSYVLGVTDMLAGLHCFVSDPLCNCLRFSPTNQAGDFGFRVGQALRACIDAGGASPAFGAVLDGAVAYCRG